MGATVVLRINVALAEAQVPERAFQAVVKSSAAFKLSHHWTSEVLVNVWEFACLLSASHVMFTLWSEHPEVLVYRRRLWEPPNWTTDCRMKTRR